VIAQGEFVEGLKEGEWVYTVGGVEEKGKYYEGEKEGLWKAKYLDNGKVFSEETYLNGIKDGKFVYYHANGVVYKREYYTNGIKEGIWEYIDENGNIYLTIEYKDGKEVKYNGEKISYGRRVDRELAEEEQTN
jgi:antitoxin component YwqK of YwqJK toxin-antitoxin module